MRSVNCHNYHTVLPELCATDCPYLQRKHKRIGFYGCVDGLRNFVVAKWCFINLVARLGFALMWDSSRRMSNKYTKSLTRNYIRNHDRRSSAMVVRSFATTPSGVITKIRLVISLTLYLWWGMDYFKMLCWCQYTIGATASTFVKWIKLTKTVQLKI